MPFLTFPIKLLLGGVGTLSVAAGTVLLTTSAVGNSNGEQRSEKEVAIQTNRDSSDENAMEDDLGDESQGSEDDEEEKERARSAESDTPEPIY